MNPTRPVPRPAFNCTKFLFQMSRVEGLAQFFSQPTPLIHSVRWISRFRSLSWHSTQEEIRVDLDYSILSVVLAFGSNQLLESRRSFLQHISSELQSSVSFKFAAENLGSLVHYGQCYERTVRLLPYAAEMIRSAVSEFRDQNSYEKPA